MNIFLRLFGSKKPVANSRYYPLLGFNPKDEQLYEQAFTASSENRKKMGALYNNERLEYLGDAVLETVVSHLLFDKYPERDEGFMSSMRSVLVKRSTLNYIGEKLEFDKYTNARLSSSFVNMYGNMFEALCGAIYLDRGFDCARAFIFSVYNERVNVEKVIRNEKNYKSQLLEYCQKHKLSLVYELVEQRRVGDNIIQFQSRAVIDGKAMGNGVGVSKRASEQAAAKYACKTLMRDRKK